MKILLPVSCFLVFLPGIAIGVPNIKNVSGTVEQNRTIRINGSAFSDSGNELPLRFDDFESGSNGVNLKGWSLTTSNDPNPTDSPPRYSNAQTWSGNLSGWSEITDENTSGPGGNCGAYIDELNLSTVYISAMQYYNITSGNPKTAKTFRVHAGNVGGNPFSGYPSVNPLDFNQSDHRITVERATNNSDDITVANGQASALPAEKWTRLEYYFKHSTPNISDGTIMYWKDGIQEYSTNDITTRNQAGNWQVFNLPFHFGNDGAGNIWYDDVYLSRSRARIEICDSPTWAGRSETTQCNIQMPTAWAGNSITARVKQGSFSTGQDVYLYVVDSLGNANPKGQPVTIGKDGGGGDPVAPPPTAQNLILLMKSKDNDNDN